MNAFEGIHTNMKPVKFEGKRKGIMMREKDRGRVTCFLLQLTDKEAMVAMPQKKINEREDE